MSMRSRARPRSRWSLTSKSKRARLADLAQHDGILLAAVRHVGERDVGDLQEHRPEPLLDARRAAVSCSLMVSPRVRMAAIACSASPPAFLTTAISSLARLRCGAHALDLGEDPPALALRGRGTRRATTWRRHPAAAAPCGPPRGCERTIFTSSIVSPRGRERRPGRGSIVSHRLDRRAVAAPR